MKKSSFAAAIFIAFFAVFPTVLKADPAISTKAKVLISWESDNIKFQLIAESVSFSGAERMINLKIRVAKKCFYCREEAAEKIGVLLFHKKLEKITSDEQYWYTPIGSPITTNLTNMVTDTIIDTE